MSIFNHLKTYLLIGAACFGSLFAEEDQISSAKTEENSKSTQSYKPVNSWKPYFVWAGKFQNKNSAFAEINIGIGFLYFDGFRANLGNTPGNIFSMIGSSPEKRDLSYSKTPLYEYIVGYQLTNWFKFAISYQNQSNIYVQTRVLNSAGGTDPTARVQFGSELQLNSITSKFYFELPWPLVWKTLAFSPYIAGGPSATWQSWFNITNRITQLQSPQGATCLSAEVPYRQKSIANIGALADAGIRFHSAYPDSNFSMTAGCKYNYWGQTRNLGMLSQQSNFKRGLFKPFRIKTLYSFAPYIGLHWIFPVTKGNIIDNQNANSDEVFYVSPDLIYPSPCVVAQINVGPNFLFFSKLRGNLTSTPGSIFFGDGQNIPLDRRLSYIKSPLIEYALGYRLNRALEMAISYQYQNETTLISRWLPGANGGGYSQTLNQFRSYLNLNAIMGKLSLDLFTAVVSNLAFTPFISAGAGASWQSWTDIRIERTGVITNSYNNNFLYLRDKIIANGTWIADTGIKCKNSSKDFLFSLVAGCKYIQWGQVRNIGKISQQGSGSFGLPHPVKAKILYSFTPYLGMQWNFPVDYKYVIKDRSINTWKPFITQAKQIQNRFSIMAQANVGPGILFFDQIRGNFAGIPSINFRQNGSSPFKGHLRYNITPVFEYVFGYRFFQWFQAAISYQNQQSLFFSTEPLVGFGATAPGAKNQFRSHLTLDAFFTKLYFEIPYPLIFKGYAFSIYFAGSPGIGWQSWKDIRVNRTFIARNTVGFCSFDQGLRQKIIANFVWMTEGGFRIRNASPGFPFSGVFGCKYIQWGLSRNIGKMDQQANNLRIAIFKPFNIKVLGSITPYVGLQWNF